MVDRLIKALLTSFYKLWLSFRGQSKVSEAFKHSKIISTIIGSTVGGHCFEFKCRKRQYLKKYKGSYFKGRMYTVFDVFCIVDENASDKVKEALSITITFPPLLPRFVDDDTHAKVIIQAYLDMILVRIQELGELGEITVH